MSRLIDDIGAFLEANGFEYSIQIRNDFDVICARTPDGRHARVILPLEISAKTLEKSRVESQRAFEAVRTIKAIEGYPIIIPEDRWNRQRHMMEARLLAHMEVFSQAYARNCEVRRIDKETAQRFLAENHSYGYAACKYRYGLFLKRHTGHIAREMGFLDCARNDSGDVSLCKVDTLIAVATFSNARKWIKDGKEIRSYEWTRYASLPDLRVSGGMGKLLKAFIKEVQPDDIMSYADLEWSEGDVYKTLGFKEEVSKDPVSFEIDPGSWERRAIGRSPFKPGMTEGGTGMTEGKPGMTEGKPGMGGTTVINKASGNLFYTNFGSRKLRLKLTDYQ